MPLNIADIYAHAPGSRFLASCPSKAQEDMLDYIYASMPATFKARTALNSSSVTSMDIAPDETPNRFSDLLGLCTKLVSAAGKRSHFEGLLIINISALSPTPDNTIRLKALGELLSMKDGLASQCITLLYGPEKECELLVCADHLDFDGKLKVVCYEQANKLSLSDLLTKSKLRCASPEVERLLESTLADMSSYEDFNAEKFVRFCGNARGIITESSVSEMMNDPYSYIGRIRKTANLRIEEPAKRKIGFYATR